MSTASAPRSIQMTAADNGRKVTLEAGDRLAVTLAGNPTTGHTWEARDLDGDLLRPAGETQFERDPSGRLGAGGMVTLTFDALEPGTTTLILVYRRRWEAGAEPADTFRLTLTIR